MLISLLVILHLPTVVTFNVWTVSHEDLLINSELTNSVLMTQFITNGIIAVSDVPRYKTIRKLASQGITTCIMNEEVKWRVSIGGDSYKGKLNDMNHKCGNSEDVKSLRHIVDNVARLVFHSLDNDRNIGNYDSFSDLMYHGNHFENIHIYSNNTSKSSANTLNDNQNIKLNLHTDSGMLIAMTRGYYTDGTVPIEQDNGLYIQLPYNDVVTKTNIDEDSIIFMIGEGGQEWLSPGIFDGQSLRAVPHALITDVAGPIKRVWYGKMFQPPKDFTIFNTSMNYQQFSDIQKSYLNNKNLNDYEALPAACGKSRKLHLVMSSSNDDDVVCPPGDVLCWMHCMSTVNLTCGQDAFCFDSVSHQEVDGNKMCSSCSLQCPLPSNNTFNGYCYGSGSAMFMEGFESILSSPRGTTECTNVLFPGWTLNNGVKFFVACVGILLFGIFIQYLTKCRFDLNKVKSNEKSHQYKVVMLYGVQVICSYLAMLIAMTYSVELFLMICIGLTIGYSLFHISSPPPASVDPCCTIDDDSKADIELSPVYNKLSNGTDGI